MKNFIKSEHAQNLLCEHNAKYKKVVVLQLSISRVRRKEMKTNPTVNLLLCSVVILVAAAAPLEHNNDDQLVVKWYDNNNWFYIIVLLLVDPHT